MYYLSLTILTEYPLNVNVMKVYRIKFYRGDNVKYTDRLKALREDNDLNQTVVAGAIHVAQTTYSDYEKGKVRIPVECLIALARFYDVDLNYIAGISNIKNDFPKE